MIRQCPTCRHRMTDFEFQCRQCGWDLMDSQQPEISSTNLAGENGAGDGSQQPGELAIGGRASASGTRLADSDLPPSQFELYLREARDLIGNAAWGKALLNLNRAIADASEEQLPECYSLRGYVYYSQGEVEQAEHECTQAIDRNWEDANTYAWRAAARGEQKKWRLAFDDLQQACDLAGSEQDQFLQLLESYSEVAREYFQERIQSGDDSADLLCERGWVYYRCSQLKKAERDFKLALSRDRDHGWASLGLALVHQQAGVMRHLTPLLEVALQGPVDCQRQALQVCAQAHHDLGDPVAAHRDLERLTQLAADNPRQQVEVCRLRYRLGDYLEAIEHLDRVLETNPEDHFASLVRGQCFQAIKNYPLANRDYTRFLRVYPEHVQVLLSRAECNLAMSKIDAAKDDVDLAQAIDHGCYEAALLRSKLLLAEGTLDAALTEAEHAIKLENRPEGFAVKAEIYHKLCDYSAAIEEYSRAIEFSRRDRAKAEYHYLRGTMLYELEDFQPAFEDFQASVSLRRNHSGAWVWKAAAASRLEDWPTAIVALEQAIAVRPAAAAPYQKLGRPVAQRAVEYFDRLQQRGQANLDTFRHRGMAHQFLGDLERAQTDFSLALDGNGGHPDTLIRRGQVLFLQGNLKQASKDFTQVIGSEPQNHLARYWRARVRQLAGKPLRAKHDIKKAIRLASEHPRYHLLLAELYREIGSPTKLIRALDKAIWHDPTDPVAYRRRAVVHANAGDTLRAIRDFTHALELDSSQAEILVSRGQAYLKSGQLELAQDDFELALTHNPLLAKAYSGRAAILVEADQLEYTLIWLTKAIHRFEKPRDLAEILFARGKVFAQVGRFAPAASDFSAVIDLMRDDLPTLLAARHARALTNMQADNFDKAAKDFQRIQRHRPADTKVQQVLKWLEHREAPKPEFLPDKIETRRPTRPPVVRAGVKPAPDSLQRWSQQPPFDTWIVRNDEKKEYGPVRLNILLAWIADGRIDSSMKLLRADWSKWKRAEKIFPEILPFDGPMPVIDHIPEIEV
jgi:tetratricopeptide (TPR) repeat protein